MKTKFLQIAVTVYFGAALLMFLTACNGGSSDPLKDYNVKGGPVTNAPSENQNKVGSDYFAVEIGNDKTGGLVAFIEGLESQVLIKIISKSTKIKNYVINFDEFPHNEIPQIHATNTAGEFLLVWKAPVGIIPPGPPAITLQSKLRITITESSDQRLVGIADPLQLPLYVSKNMIQPKITNFTSLDKGIDEGTKVPFIIEVNDPASIAGTYPPKITTDKYIYSNPEAFMADGSLMVQPDDTRSSIVENLGGGKWRFYYMINADRFVDNRDRKGNIDPNASTVDICFFLNVKNINNSSDPQNKIVCFVGRFTAQAPVLNWNEQNATEIKSGVESYFKFTIQSANGIGKVEIKDQAKLLADLSGTKSLNCDVVSAQNSNQKECLLTWTPTCSRTNSNKKLNIKAENKINNKSKETLFEKNLIVLANEELCPAKKPVTQTTKGVAK